MVDSYQISYLNIDNNLWIFSDCIIIGVKWTCRFHWMPGWQIRVHVRQSSRRIMNISARVNTSTGHTNRAVFLLHPLAERWCLVLLAECPWGNHRIHRVLRASLLQQPVLSHIFQEVLSQTPCNVTHNECRMIFRTSYLYFSWMFV